MTAEIATVLARCLEIYLLLGLLFAVVFAWRGVGRLDPAAEDGTIGFRLLVLPGAAAFWPLLLRRWIAGERTPPPERTAHDRAAAAGARKDAER